MKKLSYLLSALIAPAIMITSIYGAGAPSAPIIHEPKVPSRLRRS